MAMRFYGQSDLDADWIKSVEKKGAVGRKTAEMEIEGRISVERSIRWQLEHLTDEQAALWCEIAGVERRTASVLADGWEDFSWDGLAGLLAVTQEEKGER